MKYNLKKKRRKSKFNKTQQNSQRKKQRQKLNKWKTWREMSNQRKIYVRIKNQKESL